MPDIVQSLRANIANAIANRTSMEVGGGIFSHDELRTVLAELNKINARDALLSACIDAYGDLQDITMAEGGDPSPAMLKLQDAIALAHGAE